MVTKYRSKPVRKTKAAATAGVLLDADKVAATAKRIAPHIVCTPALHSEALSQLTGAKVFVKYENAQRTGAFKARGAVAKITTLTAAQKRAGVITMSAGNHAQGVALYATQFGIASSVVMPRTTPLAKIRKTQAYGASVILEGETFAEAASAAEALARTHGYTIIHPYDDEEVIAGQGTVAYEFLAQAPEVDTLVVPVGGGGLISGCALAARGAGRPISVFGVQSDQFPGMARALRGSRARAGKQTVAEGIAVRVPGSRTLPIVKALVKDVLTVTEEQIERAISLYATAAMTIAEGAGAAPLAAILAKPALFKGRTVGLVLSGGNIDARLLSSVLMRDLARIGQVTTLSIDMVDKPGQLHTVSGICAELGANVLEVSHSRFGLDLSAKAARLAVTVETRDASQAKLLVTRIREAGFVVSAKV